MRLVLGLIALLALLCGASSPARAEHRFPAASAVVFDPHDSKTVYVRTTFGLVTTRDGGESWHWICEKAIGFSGNEDPAYVVTPKGTLVAGTSAGAAVSRDKGCSFSFAGGPGAHVLTAISVRPDGEIDAVSSVRSKSGELHDNHLVVSKDDGQTFTVTGSLDPKLELEAIEIAPSDAGRIYLSGKREGAALVLVTYDGGMTWLDRKVDLAPGESGARLVLVDPKNADRAYVRTAGSAGSRLLVTEDAAKTWKKIFDAPSPLLGFALAEDGGRVFVGAKAGVSYAPAPAFSFAKGSSTEIQCLAMHGSTLWACSTDQTGFLVGSSRSGGRTFDPKLRLDEIKGPLECAPETNVAKECAADWPKLRRELGLPEIGEQKHSPGPSGPALRGREQKQTRERSPLQTGAMIVLSAAVLYMVGQVLLKKVRRK